MKDNVLFVNRDETEIREFLSAMQDYTFEIDTADSGLEAAALLRKKQYKVVITGMNLSTYDGTKLIAYLNSHYPYTACIVYTTRVDLAQLRLLVNKRKVFRIFLRPVNYRGDFYSAIKDGFTYYDMREAGAEESGDKKQKEIFLNGRQAGGIEREQIKKLAYSLTSWSVQNFDLQLSKQEQEKLIAYEQGILAYYFKKNYCVCGSLEEVKNSICQEFCVAPEKQKIEIQVSEKQEEVKPECLGQLHFLMWLLVRQIADISYSYAIKIKLDMEMPFYPVILIQGGVEKESWKKYRQKNTSKIAMTVVHYIVETMSVQCKRELSEDMISYRIQMGTEKYKKENSGSR